MVSTAQPRPFPVRYRIYAIDPIGRHFQTGSVGDDFRETTWEMGS